MITIPYKKYGTTQPIQLQIAAYLNGNPISGKNGCRK